MYSEALEIVGQFFTDMKQKIEKDNGPGQFKTDFNDLQGRAILNNLLVWEYWLNPTDFVIALFYRFDEKDTPTECWIDNRRDGSITFCDKTGSEMAAYVMDKLRRKAGLVPEEPWEAIKRELDEKHRGGTSAGAKNSPEKR